MDNPGAQVEQAVEQCLELAQTWLAWDGRPCVSDDGERVYTPHKAVRRIADHVIDHLAEAEALLAGVETIPDGWHASLATFESDWARFTEQDLVEARQRLRRLGQTLRCGSRRRARTSGTGRGPRTGLCGRSASTSPACSGTPSRWAGCHDEPMRIFHLATKADWDAALASGAYTTSTYGVTLADEGFIHASRADQWEGVRDRFYADVEEPLVLLEIDTDLLDVPVVEEPPAPDVQETFPHIYGPLKPEAVVAVTPLD